MTTDDRRLIEDYLPLDALNAIASKEKLHPRRYVELVHYWPARRPITACRAAVYAALTPAPRSDKEREEAASFVAKLAAYKPNADKVSEARDRIRELHGGRAPKVLDLFAGGGAIPLEAARLGCESHANDYNPVAHLIELCTLVYPQTFGSGLADDFIRWGEVILARMRDEISDLYPCIELSQTDELEKQGSLFGTLAPASGAFADPVSYIWARTVPCRRPGCEAPVPLVRQSWLRKKGGAIAAVPRIKDGNQLCWDIVSGSSAKAVSQQTGQTGSGQAVCVACNTPAPADHVKEMAVAGRMGESLSAVVAALPPKPKRKKRQKVYLPPDATVAPSPELIAKRLAALEAELGFTCPEEILQGKLRDQLPAYGMESYRELFTTRQLLVLLTLIKQIRRAHGEMVADGMPEDRARALATFFAMAFGRFVIIFNKFSRWEPKDQITRGAVGDRQALKMIYDFSEISPLAATTGSLPFALDREAFCIRALAAVGKPSIVQRGNAERLFYDDQTFDAVITDPPYYSSIYYADLSAFFYVWLKRILGELYPDHFALPAPPKRREAVAQPSEHGGDANKAKEHYERLMRNSLSEARRVLKPGAPLVCVYAHRTTEGWATLIRALVGAGMTVTEAWPIQTESRGRVNALAAAAADGGGRQRGRRGARLLLAVEQARIPRIHRPAPDRGALGRPQGSTPRTRGRQRDLERHSTAATRRSTRCGGGGRNGGRLQPGVHTDAPRLRGRRAGSPTSGGRRIGTARADQGVLSLSPRPDRPDARAVGSHPGFSAHPWRPALPRLVPTGRPPRWGLAALARSW